MYKAKIKNVKLKAIQVEQNIDKSKTKFIGVIDIVNSMTKININ